MWAILCGTEGCLLLVPTGPLSVTSEAPHTLLQWPLPHANQTLQIADTLGGQHCPLIMHFVAALHRQANADTSQLT